MALFKAGRHEVRYLRRKASGSAGPQKGKRKGLLVWSLAPMLALILCIVVLIPTSSYFSDTESASCQLSIGEWGNEPSISCICPNWGICGACCWAVFIHGNNLGDPEGVQLIRDGLEIAAKKTWHIDDTLIFAVFDLRKVSQGWYDVKVVTESGEAVLENGFKVIGWFCCVPSFNRSYPGGEDNLQVEKMLDEKKPGALYVQINGRLPKIIDSVSLVAQDFLTEGEVISKDLKSLYLRFDVNEAPQCDYDIVITVEGGWNLILEKAIRTEDLVPPMEILSLDPTHAIVGETVDISVKGKNIADDSDFQLCSGDQSLIPATVHVIDSCQAVCSFNLGEALPGIYDLKAIDSGKRETVLAACFSVQPCESGTPDNQEGEEEQCEVPPMQEPIPEEDETADIIPDDGFSVNPVSARSGSPVNIVIEGGPFYKTMQARLRRKGVTVWAQRCEFPSATRMKCRFSLYGVPPGDYVLEVLDRHGVCIYIAGFLEVSEGGR